MCERYFPQKSDVGYPLLHVLGENDAVNIRNVFDMFPKVTQNPSISWKIKFHSVETSPKKEHHLDFAKKWFEWCFFFHTVCLGAVGCGWWETFVVLTLPMFAVSLDYILSLEPYYRFSIYRSDIWYKSAHSTTISIITFRSDLHSRTTPHTSPLRASYEMSFVSYTKRNDRDMCTVL